MDNIFNLFEDKKELNFEFIYCGDVVTGVTHKKWPYIITRNGAQRALVCKDTGEPLGKLMKDDFNTLLICWLLIDEDIGVLIDKIINS